MATDATQPQRRNKRSRKGCRRNSPQRIEAALTALVLNGGNAMQTAQQLGMPESTLADWRLNHAETYKRIQEQRAPELERIITHQAREFILTAGHAERIALTATLQALANGNIRDPAATLRNLSVSKAVNVDKLLALEGRPTTVIEHRNSHDLLRSLSAKGFVDSTATEIPPQINPPETSSGEVDEANVRSNGHDDPV